MNPFEIVVLLLALFLTFLVWDVLPRAHWFVGAIPAILLGFRLSWGLLFAITKLLDVAMHRASSK